MYPQLVSADKPVRPQLRKEKVGKSGTWVKDIKGLEDDIVDGTDTQLEIEIEKDAKAEDDEHR